VLDRDQTFATKCNQQMVGLETVTDPEEIADLRQMIERHQQTTGSARAAEVLSNWDAALPRFVKVMPTDYKRVLQAIQEALRSGLSGDEALTAAFEANVKDVARIGGS
jgi:glutamate synthase (ferredoxin)